MMQKTDFNFEVLIHDDASTDGTACIIREYEAKYPDIIKPIYQTENQASKGIKNTLVYQFPRARGEYLAFCEGDDYWVDPLKLQKQVDFLDANKEYVLCFHDRDIVNANSNESYRRLNYEKRTYTGAECYRVHIPVMSIVFRNIVSSIPKEIYPEYIDVTLFIYLSQFGSFYFMPFVGGIYRAHPQGIWSGNSMLGNYNRSISARLTSRKYYKNIDKKELGYVICEWLQKKMKLQKENKTYFSLLKTFTFYTYFRIYNRLSTIRN